MLKDIYKSVLFLAFASVLVLSAPVRRDEYQCGWGKRCTWTLSNGVLTITTTESSVELVRKGEWIVSDVKKVILEGDFVKISNYVFSDCPLTEVTLPDSVKIIDGYAFSGSGLTAVTIPSSVTEIGNNAFKRCYNLTSVTISGAITTLGEAAFYECTALTSITIPGNNITIENSAFRGCSSLQSATITGSVTSIGEDIFFWCDLLTSLTIPESPMLIFEDSFPESFYTSYENGFYFGSSNNPYYFFLKPKSMSYESFTINPNTRVIAGKAFDGSSLKSFEVPSLVTVIGEHAFGSSGNLASVTLPESLQIIGPSAFSGCRSLQSLTIPDSVHSIGEKAFEKCTVLASVNLPKAVSQIPSQLFSECSSLASVTIEENVTYIGSQAFKQCSSLVSLTIPGTVSEIGDSAFESCISLSEVEYFGTSDPGKKSNDPNGYHENIFKDCPVSEVNVPSNYDGFVFCGISARVVKEGVCGDNCAYSLVLPRGMLTINGTGEMSTNGWNEFASLINDVEIVDGITSVVTNAFNGYTNLSSIVIANSVTKIGENSFSGCSSLTSVTLPDSVTSVEASAFSDCTSLKSVKMSSFVTSVGASAFSGCSSLNSVKIPDTVTSLGASAFNGCSSLRSITIPHSVTTLEASVFSGCSLLKSVNIPNSVTSIGNSAFEGCSSFTSVIIPDSVTSVGNSVFKDCRSLAEVNYLGKSDPGSGSSNVFDNCPFNEVTVPQDYTDDLFCGKDVYLEIGGLCGRNCTWTLSLLGKLTVTGFGPMDFGTKSLSSESTYSSDKDTSDIYASDASSFSWDSSSSDMDSEAWRPYTSDIKVVVIDEGITSIQDSAFSNCVSLLSVSIPKSVTSIESRAFYGCSSLADIEYFGTNDPGNESSDVFTGCPDNVVTVPPEYSDDYFCEKRVFFKPGGECGSGCSWTLSLDGKLIISGTGSVSCGWSLYSSDVKKVEIGDEITSIKDSAFSNCTLLTSVTIPDSVVLIESNAFYGCSSLSEVKYLGTSDPGRKATDVFSGSSVEFVFVTGDYTDVLFCGKNAVIGHGAFGSTIIWTLSARGKLTISGTGQMDAQNWTEYVSVITELEIGDGITSIVSQAFAGLTSLSLVVVSGSVTSIGDEAFYGCSSLSEFEYLGSNDPGSSSSYVFRNCPLEKVFVPYYYNDEVFCDTFAEKGRGGDDCGSNCSWSLSVRGKLVITGSGEMEEPIWTQQWEINIKEAVIGYGFTSIGTRAFQNTEYLTSITIPASVKSIGEGAFFKSGLTSITLPASVISIGREAFVESGLTSIIIPATVTSIGYCAFRSCKSLSEVLYLGTNNPGSASDRIFDDTAVSVVEVTEEYTDDTFCGVNVALTAGECGSKCSWYLSASGTLTIVGSGAVSKGWEVYSSDIKKVEFNGFFATIGASTFSNCSSLSSITIPTSVTSIGEWAFYNCISLSSVTIPNSVTSIREWAFANSNLTSIMMSSSVSSIADWTFANTNLKSINIPSSVTSIGQGAFANTNFTSIEIPSSVTSIKSSAFYGCLSLTKVKYFGTRDPGNESSDVFYGCPIDYVPVGTSYVDEWFCGKIALIDKGTCGCNCSWTLLPVGVKLVVSGENCAEEAIYTTWTEFRPDIEEVLIDKNINKSAFFANYPSLVSVTLADSVTSIGIRDYYNCPSLTSVVLSKNTVTISGEAFRNCTSLPSITIPDSVTTIGEDAFSDCTNLSTVVYLGKSDLNDCPDNVFSNTRVNVVIVPDDYSGNRFCNIRVNKTDLPSSSSSVPVSSSSSHPPVVSSSSIESSSHRPVVSSSSSHRPAVSSSSVESSSHTPVVSSSSIESSSHRPVVSSSSVESSSPAPVTCADDEYVSQNVCKKCSAAIVACRKCSNGVTCTECRNGYKLTEGRCVFDCTTAFGEGCSECSSKACLNCTGTECCSKKKHYWDGNNCVHPSSKFGDGCLETDGVKCTKCTAPTCCADKEFYDYSKSTCSACPDNCAKCSAAGCLECDEGMITDATGACLTCSAIYGVGCSKCGRNGCTETEVGDPDDPYCIVAGMCKHVSEAYGASCANYSNNMCTECKDSTPKTVLIDGFCKECSAVFGSDCTDCSSTVCTQCNELKLLNGACVGPAEAFGEGCEAFDANKEKCGTAKSGYFVDGVSGYAMSCQVLLDEDLKDQCNNPSGRRSIKTVIREDGIRVEFEGQECTADPTLIDPNCEVWEDSCKQCYSNSTLYGGVCKPCTELFGDTCTECTLASCTACSEGVAFHGSCVNCNDFIPSCTECSSVDVCTECGDNLQVKDGVCVDCQVKYGEGCQECDATKCTTCTADGCCGKHEKIIKKNDALQCGTCSVLAENCVSCTSAECLACAEGMAVDEDGSCMQCSDLFSGCGKCNSEECTACSEEGWILTPNGCYYEDIPVSSSVAPSDVSSSSHSSRTPSSHSSRTPSEQSSMPIVPTKSSSEGGSNAGMIAGIVVAVVVVVAIAAVAIYCILTSGAKHGKIDSSIYEDEDETREGFISMSVL